MTLAEERNRRRKIWEASISELQKKRYKRRLERLRRKN